MHNLPVAVADEDIADMFAVADSDSDGRISYKEFQKMINPPKPPEGPKPTKQDFVKRFSQVIPDPVNLMKILFQASPVCAEMEPLLQESPVMVTISGDSQSPCYQHLDLVLSLVNSWLYFSSELNSCGDEKQQL